MLLLVDGSGAATPAPESAPSEIIDVLIPPVYDAYEQRKGSHGDGQHIHATKLRVNDMEELMNVFVPGDSSLILATKACFQQPLLLQAGMKLSWVFSILQSRVWKMKIGVWSKLGK